MKSKKLLTKEINVITGLCLYDYNEELIEKVIKHFPTWRLYKVKFRERKNSIINGLFLTNLKFNSMKDITPEEETITERFSGTFIENDCDSFRLKYQNKIEKFMSKSYVPWYIHFVAIPKESEILNLGTDDLTFR